MKYRKNIALCNLLRKPGRSIALLCLSLFLCFSILGGSLVISGLKSGLSSLETRLGADLMVVPYSATTKSDLSNIILQGNPGYFYMNRSVMDEIDQEIDGIGQISEQFYLASASSGCCSLKVQIIGYNPETDFTIKPWIGQKYKKDLDYMEILVGNDLNAFAGDILTFYGQQCKVVAKLDKTGTYLDSSVYANEETIKTLIQSAKDTKLMDFGDVNPDQIISCVLINVAEGYSVEEVMNNINLHVRGVVAVQTQNMISNVASGLTNISDLIGGLIAVIWVLAFAILVIAFTMITNERKKEFAIYRAMGASQRQLSQILLKEGFLLSLAGSILGAILALLVVISFRSFIEETLALPFLLPGVGMLLLLILAAIAGSILASSLTCSICAKRISRIDTALILRGEN